MKRLTIVRHGETYQNRNHVVQGQHPHQGRLTPEGMRQAELLGKALADEPFDKVYTSTLERAVLTMSLVLMQRPGEHTLPIRFADELREIHLGILHGEPHTSWRSSIQGDPMAWRPEGGESWLDVQQRATEYLRGEVLANGDRNVLIVAHGGVNRGLIASLLDLPIGTTWLPAGEGTPQYNTCINRFELDDDGNVVAAVVNDTRHLDGVLESAGGGQRWHPQQRGWVLLGPPEASESTRFLAP